MCQVLCYSQSRRVHKTIMFMHYIALLLQAKKSLCAGSIELLQKLQSIVMIISGIAFTLLILKTTLFYCNQHQWKKKQEETGAKRGP